MPSTADYHFEIARLRSNLAAQQANIARQVAQLMDHMKNQAALVENIQAAKKAIVEIEEQIAGLVDAHGDFDIESLLR